MFDTVIRDFKNYAYSKELQFHALPDNLKPRAVAKTTIVATAAGLTAGLVYGSFIGTITFAATAVYVGTSVLDRFSAIARTPILKPIPINFGAEVGNAVDDIVTDAKDLQTKIHIYGYCKVQQFQALPDFFKVRLILKTLIVATAFGLTSGLLLGSVKGLCAFTLTALYVSSTVLERLSAMSTQTTSKILKQFGVSLVVEVEKVVEDVVTDVKRGAEDLYDSLFTSRSDSKKLEKKKEIERVTEDLQTDLSRFLTDAWSDLKFTMSL